MTDLSSTDNSRELLCHGAIAGGFDPLSGPLFDDMHHFFARARAEEPVFYWPPMDTWVVTRHDEILSILRDAGTFAHQALVLGGVVPLAPEVAALVEKSQITSVGENPFTSEGERHRAIRRVVTRSISPRRMEQMRPVVQDTIDALIDSFEEQRHVELVSAFSFSLPITVIFTWLGFPEADAQRFKLLSDECARLLTMPMPPEEQMRCAHTVVEFYEYAAALLEERRADLREDFISDVLRAERDGALGLTSQDIIELFVTMILGGHETTAAMITNMMLHVLEDRSRWERLCADPGAIPAVVEEALRFDPPLIGSYRRTTRDVELGGVKIPSGANVWWLLASGNHDEAAFECPDEFRFDRSTADTHLTFGHGSHFCVGAALARLELSLTLENFVRRLPGLELAPDQSLSYDPNPMMRHLTALQLCW